MANKPNKWRIYWVIDPYLGQRRIERMNREVRTSTKLAVILLIATLITLALILTKII